MSEFGPVAESPLELIGNTAVLPLNRLGPQGSAEIYGKYEAGNPSLSVKDRIVYRIIDAAVESGQLKPGGTIAVATMGNTGIALGLVAACRRFELIIFMPEDYSLERRKMFEGYGVKLHMTPSEEGVPGAKKRLEDYLKLNPDVFSFNQFDHPLTITAHAESTAQEILADFPEGLDALVCGVGTGGTIMGVGRVLKDKFPQIKIIAVEPSSSALLSGESAGKHRIQQLGPGFVPPNVDLDLIDQVVKVSDKEAYMMTKRLSRREGLLLGISSGANVHASIQVAQEMGAGKKVLTFLCDAGQRYFSIEEFFHT